MRITAREYLEQYKALEARVRILQAEVERIRTDAEGLHYDDCEADNCSCSYIQRILDIPSADVEPTVIRSRTLLPTKDFKEWAKRVRETNPNAVVIPCDAEVVSADTEKPCKTCGYYNLECPKDCEYSRPSADAVDCTDFIEWLVDRVLDETIWEYNSVAYGEIICRKLEKLGVLEVTEEPSYYIRPSADAEQGEWLEIEDYNGDYHYQCSVCKDEFYLEYGTPKENGYAYCPSCGARMVKGGDTE